ncbi:TPA: hypothetical protein HA361_02725 [Candidatus Woesearchaeota archaeon]|nr:hypothetical protein [Candidatus Woesearchaeota archaeon]
MGEGTVHDGIFKSTIPSSKSREDRSGDGDNTCKRISLNRRRWINVAMAFSKTKTVLLAIAIAIILSLFVGYSINTLFHEPKYEDFCNSTEDPLRMEKPASSDHSLVTQASCEEDGGKWNAYQGQVEEQYMEKYVCDPEAAESGKVTLNCIINTTALPRGYCDFDYYCREDFESAQESHGRLVFILSGIVGLIAIVIGGLILRVEAVGSGIMGGGILAVIYGTLRYWGNLPDYARVIILGIVLAVLIWMGYRKLQK